MPIDIKLHPVLAGAARISEQFTNLIARYQQGENPTAICIAQAMSIQNFSNGPGASLESVLDTLEKLQIEENSHDRNYVCWNQYQQLVYLAEFTDRAGYLFYYNSVGNPDINVETLAAEALEMRLKAAEYCHKAIEQLFRSLNLQTLVEDWRLESESFISKLILPILGEMNYLLEAFYNAITELKEPADTYPEEQAKHIELVLKHTETPLALLEKIFAQEQLRSAEIKDLYMDFLSMRADALLARGLYQIKTPETTKSARQDLNTAKLLYKKLDPLYQAKISAERNKNPRNRNNDNIAYWEDCKKNIADNKVLCRQAMLAYRPANLDEVRSFFHESKRNKRAADAELSKVTQEENTAQSTSTAIVGEAETIVSPTQKRRRVEDVPASYTPESSPLSPLQRFKLSRNLVSPPPFSLGRASASSTQAASTSSTQMAVDSDKSSVSTTPTFGSRGEE